MNFLCCSACQPRYRRLVQAIYPSSPEQGLINLNMQKLTFYAISHPEKLDRVSNYLVERLTRDISRQRMGYVRVAVQAMDQLLAACHGSPSLNLFVENFLKMVQRLYESESAELDLLGTESFVTFANIEEDAPSYYRRYDFFICKFCVLCHNGSRDLTLRRKLRCAGIKGIRGVVRKTVNDQLQANIWEKQHMEKIVPSLLLNMQENPCPTPVTDNFDSDAAAIKANMVATNGLEESPFAMADASLRELVSKATFSNIKAVMDPALNHCDNHQLWEPASCAVTCLEAIMYSIQSQYGYVVIQSVLEHLDKHSNSDPEVRVGIATALSRLVAIAASASIGPCLLEIFNSMLRHLRQSVELESSGSAEDTSSDAEKRYQEILINTMGNFSVHLPDYQKVEIMVFIIGKVPTDSAGQQQSDSFLRQVLVRTLLKVAATYRAGHFSAVFTNPFLVSLLQLACVQESKVRLVVHRILHTLLDRHKNLEALESVQLPRDARELHISLNRFTKTDVMFIRKNSSAIFSALHRSALMANNTSDNYDAIFCTLALILIEVGSEDVVVDLFRLCLAIQGAAYDPSLQLGFTQMTQLKMLVLKYMSLAATMLAIPQLYQLVDEVRSKYEKSLEEELVEVPYLEESDVRDDTISVDKISVDVSEYGRSSPTDQYMFCVKSLSEVLKLCHYDTSQLGQPLFTQVATDRGGAGSDAETSSLSLDIRSVDSGSQDISRRSSVLRKDTLIGSMDLETGILSGPLTFDNIHKAINQPLEYWTKRDDERTKEIVEMFTSLPFTRLVEIQKENVHGLKAVC